MMSYFQDGGHNVIAAASSGYTLQMHQVGGRLVLGRLADCLQFLYKLLNILQWKKWTMVISLC